MNSLSQRSSANAVVHGADSGDRAASDAESDCGPLLAELEMSMRSSQRMLLQREIEQLETATDRQAALIRKISAFVARSGNSAEFVRMHLASAQRVLQLGRVQLALLNRMQQFLDVGRNRAAGSAATYDDPLKNARAVAGGSFPATEG